MNEMSDKKVKTSSEYETIGKPDSVIWVEKEIPK